MMCLNFNNQKYLEIRINLVRAHALGCDFLSVHQRAQNQERFVLNHEGPTQPE